MAPVELSTGRESGIALPKLTLTVGPYLQVWALDENGAKGMAESGDVETRPDIALLIPNLLGGGAERYAVNLSGSLADRGHRVDLVVGRAIGPLLNDVSPAVKLVELGNVHSKRNLFKLAAYLRRQRPAAVLSAQPGANIIALLARGLLMDRDIRIVVSQHTDLIEERQHNRVSVKTRMSDLLAKRLYHRADAIVAVSNGVKKSLHDGMDLSSDAVQVIYNPVINECLRSKPRPRLAHDWLGPNNPPVIVAVGRLSYEKGFDLLIRAIADVARWQEVLLIILGDGPERAGLKALVSRLGLGANVDLVGYVEDVLAYLQQADVFALSSRYEGLPTALIEAMFAGLLIVAADCPSGPREILLGGAYGLLVAAGDSEALADGLAKALRGRVAAPPPESWRRFESSHVIEEYEAVLSRPGPARQ